MKRLTSLSLLLLLFFVGCKPNTETLSGEVLLRINSNNSPDGRVSDDVDIAFFVISLEDADGNLILDEKTYAVTGYTSEPILLTIGTYKLVKFLVLNSTDEVIYATPVSGSTLASLVSAPLPISFDINSDEVTNLELEVISTASKDPEDLGYSNLSFNIISTSQILVSVMQKDGQEKYFSESYLTIIGDGDSLYHVFLGDSIELVTLRDDYNETELKFQVEDDDKSVFLSREDIFYHRTVPLVVIFESSLPDTDLTSGLLAHYSFSGDASDASGHGFDGVLGDGNGSNTPSIVEDRGGNPNSAYYFDGNSYIDLGEGDQFNIVDYDEFTFAFWTKSETDSDGVIWSKYIAASDNRMWSIKQFEGQFAFHIYEDGASGTPIDSVSAPKTGDWQHLVITSSGGMLKLYSDGVLASSRSLSVNILNSAPTAKTLIGAVHFSSKLFDRLYTGYIDDLYFYERALNAEEVKELWGK